MAKKTPMDIYGSSDLILWHYFSLFTAMTLILIPIIGSIMAVLTLLIIGTSFATWVSSRDHRSYIQAHEGNIEYKIFIQELDNRLNNNLLFKIRSQKSVGYVFKLKAFSK